MKRKALSLIALFLLFLTVLIQELGAGWPRIPATAYVQTYGNVVVRSDFRPVPQSVLIRWSLSRNTWLQRLNWWTLEQSPFPVQIVLISTEKRAQIFQGFPAFAVPGVYFYDSNNNAFWFDEDISQNNTLVFLENGDFYFDSGGNYHIAELIQEKLFRWIYGPNEAWNTRAFWGHNPFLFNAYNYAASLVVAKVGPPPREFSYERYFVSWREVKTIARMAGFPKEHLDRIASPTPSRIITDPDRYRWYHDMGIVDRETAGEQFRLILSFFAGTNPRAQELRRIAVRGNLEILEQICQKRKDC